jgi:hypothetical protein
MRQKLTLEIDLDVDGRDNCFVTGKTDVPGGNIAIDGDPEVFISAKSLWTHIQYRARLKARALAAASNGSAKHA